MQIGNEIIITFTIILIAALTDLTPSHGNWLSLETTHLSCTCICATTKPWLDFPLRFQSTWASKYFKWFLFPWTASVSYSRVLTCCQRASVYGLDKPVSVFPHQRTLMSIDYQLLEPKAGREGARTRETIRHRERQKEKSSPAVAPLWSSSRSSALYRVS